MTAGGSRARPAVRLVRDYAPAAAFLGLLVLAWEGGVAAFDTPPYLLPAPSGIWEAFLETRDILPAHLRTTLAEALIGLALAALAGVALAAVIASSAFARRAVYPIVVVSQNVPLIVLAPLLVIWFGFGMAPKVLVVALAGFFPIAVNTVDGLRSADREMVELVRSMGASRGQVLRSVLIPSAVPSFFAGLKISAAYAVIGAVIGEWVGASSGLGLFITRSQTAFRVDRVFVAIALIATLSIALFTAVHLAERLAMPWRAAARTEEGPQ